jgi:hypothetical protein
MPGNRCATIASPVDSRSSDERHAWLLRAWHLALLRLALTRDNADRLGVLAIANEIDRLGDRLDDGSGFRFFRRTSLELCAAVLRQQEDDQIILKGYLAQIGDVRLCRALAAALDIPQQKANWVKNRPKPKSDLWRGLSSRGSP